MLARYLVSIFFQETPAATATYREVTSLLLVTAPVFLPAWLRPECQPNRSLATSNIAIEDRMLRGHECA